MTIIMRVKNDICFGGKLEFLSDRVYIFLMVLSNSIVESRELLFRTGNMHDLHDSARTPLPTERKSTTPKCG